MIIFQNSVSIDLNVAEKYIRNSILAEGNEREARKLFHEKFPNHRRLSLSTFATVDKRLGETCRVASEPGTSRFSQPLFLFSKI